MPTQIHHLHCRRSKVIQVLQIKVLVAQKWGKTVIGCHAETSPHIRAKPSTAAVLDKPAVTSTGSQEVKGQRSGVTTCLHLSSRLLSPGREATVELLPDASSFSQIWSVWDTPQLTLTNEHQPEPHRREAKREEKRTDLPDVGALRFCGPRDDSGDG